MEGEVNELEKAAIATIRAENERLRAAVLTAQDYINNQLGVPSPDFLATPDALCAAE